MNGNSAGTLRVTKYEQGEPALSEQKRAGEQDAKKMSRRQFLTNSGFAIGGLAVGVLLEYAILKQRPAENAAPQQGQAQPNFNEALMYFTQEQFEITQAAVERIFPADENGPGAAELGVAFFIDHQLAGEWGFNAREYMQPPFYTGEKTQGYQGRLNRRELFYIGLREMQNYSQSKYGKRFVDLAPEEQDAVLTAFQNDEVQLTTISASGFFNMLRSATLEGVYSDPLYGGNKNMQGWAMRNYPGSQMSYATIIDKEFTVVPAVSLKDHIHKS
jgi:gluconate 2-dehydrogenase gamma chain